MIIGAPEADLVGLLIDAGAAFVFQTFEDPGDLADGNGRSGGTCFIGTAVKGSKLNSAMVVLEIGMLSLVGIFLKRAGLKRESVKRSFSVL
jgi:hypothetical protein